jgi:phage shock protein B
MMDVFWGITLALWAYVFIPFLILRVSDWVKDKHAIRKDRKRIDQLMADAEAQREQYRTPTNP